MKDPIMPSGGQEYEKSPEEFAPKKEKYGLFRGIVEDVNDPDRLCRVKVRIDGIHVADKNAVPTDSIWWAEVSMVDGGGANHGWAGCPYGIGDAVLVMLIRGQSAPHEQAVVIGTWYGMNKENKHRFSEVPEEIWRYHDADDTPLGSNDKPEIKPNGIYPRRRVIKTRHGHVIELSDEPGDFEIILRTPIGQKIWIRESLSTDGKKLYPKGIKLIDDAGNYIHMRTEAVGGPPLLDIYWQGDKRERITGDSDVLIGGDLTEDVAGDIERTAHGAIHRDDGPIVDHDVPQHSMPTI